MIESVGLVDQSYRGVLTLRGERVVDALHAVLSSDVKGLAVGQLQRSCLLTPKGRVVGAFELFHDEAECFSLLLAEPSREPFVVALSKYVLLSDVEVHDCSSDYATFAVQGPHPESVVARLGGDAAASVVAPEFTAIDVGPTQCRLFRGGETPEGGYVLRAPLDAAEDVWSHLHEAVKAAGGSAVGFDAAEILRVEAGVARHGIDYDDTSFPTEFGWDDALTYDKCYVGQEVVARMRTYGQVSRKLRGLIAPPDAPIAVGAPLCSDGADAGVVTSVVTSPRLGRRIALASVLRKFFDRQQFDIAVGDRAVAVEVVDLPVPLS